MAAAAVADRAKRRALLALQEQEAELESYLFPDTAVSDEASTENDQALLPEADVEATAKPGFWEDQRGTNSNDKKHDGDGVPSTSMRGQHKQPNKRLHETAARKAAWEDPDDAAVLIPVASVSRLRKLRRSEDEVSLTGQQYEQRLRQQHAKLHPRTGWAALDRDSGVTSGLEPESAALLRTAGGLVQRAATLPKGLIELSRLRDANAGEPAEGVVNSVRFHPRGNLLLAAGLDKKLRLFKVDGVRNTPLQSLFLEDTPIHDAQWAGGGNYIVAAGRRAHFYVMDVQTARCERVAGCFGAPERSYESFAASPGEERPLLAFFGNKGSIPLFSLQSRQRVGSLRCSGSVRCGAFGSDGVTLHTAGGDGVVHTWDLRTRHCIGRDVDEGSLGTTALAADPTGKLLAAGSSSGVVNLYNARSAAAKVATDEVDALPMAATSRVPLKALLNLTTSIDSLRISPDGAMLAMSSRLKRDALRLVHLPSRTIFSNWPTSRSPLGFVHSVDFSPGCGLLAVGNAKGRVLLYRLHHYDEE